MDINQFTANSPGEIVSISGLRGADYLGLIIDSLFDVPVLQIPQVAQKFDITYPTARADIEKLLQAGVVVELPNTGQKTYVCQEILDIIYE